MKPNCHNRPDYRDTVTVQNGWRDALVFDAITGGNIETRVPNMIEIPFTMSKECQQLKAPFGEAYIHGWNCEGCSQYDRA